MNSTLSRKDIMTWRESCTLITSFWRNLSEDTIIWKPSINIWKKKEILCAKQPPNRLRNSHLLLTRRKMFWRVWTLNSREGKILKRRSNSSVLLLPVGKHHLCLFTVTLSRKLRNWELKIQFQHPNPSGVEDLSQEVAWLVSLPRLLLCFTCELILSRLYTTCLLNVHTFLIVVSYTKLFQDKPSAPNFYLFIITWFLNISDQQLINFLQVDHSVYVFAEDIKWAWTI